jgi:hypothetical protein
MPAVAERAQLRLLRRLLGRARLAATLEAAGVPWIDEPGNLDPAAPGGCAPPSGLWRLTTARLTRTAAELGRARALDAAVAALSRPPPPSSGRLARPPRCGRPWRTGCACWPPR